MSTALLAMVVLPYFISWRYLFFIPAILAILSSILIFNRLRDTPESLNLPSIEKMAGIETGNEDSTEPRLTYVEILKTALSNKFVWIVSVANFFLYFCKTTFLTWGPTFLMERGISMCQTTWQMILLDAAGLIGGIGSGYLSDKVFKGRRGPISTMCMIALVAPVALLLASNSQSICSICMFCVGFVTSGPQLLIGIAATDFTSKKVAATANGFTGTLGYAGMAFSGVGTGLLVDHYGWNSVFFAIIFTALASAALLSLTWNKKAAILEKTAK
jgi:sugar phosphate permease